MTATPATRHPHHFDDLSPEDFERLVYWLVRRSGEFDEVQWYGGARDKGRDVVAYRHTEAGREKWYIQCKRYQRITFATLRDELDKVAEHAEGEPDFAPDVVVFATACPVPPQAKDQAAAHASALGLPEPYYWGRVELDERLKGQPRTEEEFFGVPSRFGPLYPPSPAEARPPFTLPPDLPTFTGRAELLDELDRLLQPGGQATVSIVGLRGMAGVGKSVLAIHAAYRWRGRFPDGVIWNDLREENAACEALRHVAGLYGYREEAARLGDEPKELAALVRTVLRGKQALLILDNAEGLKPEVLDCLLPGVEGPVTVITSRRAFPALARLGRPLRVDVMDEEETLALLGELVGEQRVAAEREGYRELAERLGRLPLALDIAGRQMAERGWGPGEMVRRLEEARDRPAFLALPLATKPEESVGLAFALSYEGLGEGERELFRALSAFPPAGFTPQAVAAVVGEEVDEAGAEAALERLEALSLVRRAETEDRYDLHPLLRDYTQALAEGEEERERWAERHARHFTALADWGAQQLGDTGTALEAVGMATTERGNLLAAQETALALGLWDEAVHLAYDMGDLFKRSGHWADWRRVVERGIEAARKDEKRRDEAALAHNLGVLAHRQGEIAEARRLYQESLDIAQQLGDRAGVARSLHQLGMLAQDQGETAEARRLYGEAAEAFEQLGAQQGQAAVLHQLGWLTQQQGDYAEARRLYQESLGIAQQLRGRAGVAISLHHLGMLAQAQGDYAEARRLYQESLDIKQQLGDRAGVARSLHQLGRLAQQQGEYAETRRLCQEAAETFEQLGAQREQAAVLHQLGRLAQAQGETAEARRLYQESLDIAQQLGDRDAVARSLHQLGELAELQGDYAEARRLCQEAAETFEQLGAQREQAAALHNLGMLAEEDGDLEEAERLFGESLATFEVLGSPDAEVARGSLERVRLQMQPGCAGWIARSAAALGRVLRRGQGRRATEEQG